MPSVTPRTVKRYNFFRIKIFIIDLISYLKIADIKINESIDTQSVIHNITPSSVEHEGSPISKSNTVFGFKIPQFRKSIRIALQKGSLRNDERLHIIETVSNHMFDVMR